MQPTDKGSTLRLEEHHRADEIRLPCFGITIRLDRENDRWQA